MDKHIKDILKGALQEALKLPIDQLDKVDPTKLTKLATKADVVIGEDNTQAADPKMMQNIKTILFSIISEQGITDASFYLATKLPIPPARMVHIFSKPTWGENLEDFLKGISVEDLEKFYQEEKDRLQPTLNESREYILDPLEVTKGMTAYCNNQVIGKVITIVPAENYPLLLDFDSDEMLPNGEDSETEKNFFDKIDPENDFLVAIQYSDGSTNVGAYGQADFYCLMPSRAPQGENPTNSSQNPTINEDSQFPTATPEQQQGIFNLQSWAAELGVDIGVGEETVGDIIKFGFEGAEGWITILVDPYGKIKVSGHAINTFEDFSDILNFFTQ